MSNDQLVEQFKLLKRAKKLEEMGSADRALDLYIELHEKFEPNTSDAYERPAVIYERKRQYDKALELCHKAIEAIENDKMSGTKDKFQRRIDAINEKLKDVPVKEKVITDDYRFHIIGFRSKNKGKSLTAVIFYIIFIIMGVLLKSIYPTLLLTGIVYLVTYFVDVFQSKSKKKAIFIALLLSLTVTVFAAFNLPEAINRVIELESSEGSLEGGEQLFTESEEDRPVITEKHKEEAISLISSEIEVEEATIIVAEDQIAFGLKLLAGTDKNRAMDLLEEFIEILAHRVSGDEDIKAPDFKSHGELYDYYDLTLAGGSDAGDIVAKGSKKKTSNFISWTE
ncbi:hypothetical protein EZV73_14345 [Acidaminobacter sp. JC074]|uniref:tetratricopeptide repeat protein n=1 Tax=Acidaminobacter sp. JC074 TaxID=2530199 RepID=UPI001F0F79B0|nr:hypothetical protein [Acidaminobacter sp. JC074]MCH4888771.1 hypothetical protein [Acidaminobacter sp. JC074]